jgi:hypothetical protein
MQSSTVTRAIVTTSETRLGEFEAHIAAQALQRKGDDAPQVSPDGAKPQSNRRDSASGVRRVRCGPNLGRPWVAYEG